MPRLVHPIAVLRRFARARQGATAVEFALIAIPMIFLVMGFLELGLLLLVGTTLDTATQAAARDLRTGFFQIGRSNLSAEDRGKKTDRQAFADTVCANMGWLQAMDCLGRVQVEAQVFANFTDAGGSRPRVPTDDDPPPPPDCWAVPEPVQIAVVRVYYRWPIVNPMLNNVLTKGVRGARELSSATVIRSEPWDTPGPQVGRCS